MPIYGCDALGGKHYLNALHAAARQGDCVGIFLRTFSDSRRAVHRMMKSGKFSEIVVHFAPFDNSHRYPVKSLKPQLLDDAKWAEKLAKDFPKTKLLISPFCEHNHPAKVMSPLFKELQNIAPSCIMLNSIWKGEAVSGIITEIHLTNSKPVKKPKGEYTVAFDGFGGDGSGDFPDADIPTILARYPDARQIRYWNFCCNGKYGHLDKAPVNARKNWPNFNQLKSMRAMMKVREGQVSWDKKNLYKPMADDHDGDQPKDNKAMCILSGKNLESAKVFDSNKKVIDVMRRMRPDHPNTPKGARFYSDKYSYQIGDIAYGNTGSRLISIEDMPLTDADLRSNLFR